MFLWPDIEAEGRELTGHFLSILSRSEEGFHLVTYWQFEWHARVSDRAAEGFLISDYLGHAGNTRYQGA